MSDVKRITDAALARAGLPPTSTDSSLASDVIALGAKVATMAPPAAAPQSLPTRERLANAEIAGAEQKLADTKKWWNR